MRSLEACAAAGVLSLTQPFAIAPFSWSFPVALTGTTMVSVVSHVPA